MTRCRYCGEEIIFRYVDDVVTPIHLSGGWCCGVDRSSQQSSTSALSVVARYEKSYQDVCHPTKCPICRRLVFFIRHNGGCVWVNEPGWPWPKHECFEKKPEPAWLGYMRKAAPIRAGFSGLIVRGKWVREGQAGSSRIALAVDCVNEGRLCVLTTGAGTPRDLVGHVVVVDLCGNRLVVSNYQERPILNVTVRPEDLELPCDWSALRPQLAIATVSSPQAVTSRPQAAIRWNSLVKAGHRITVEGVRVPFHLLDSDLWTKYTQDRHWFLATQGVAIAEFWRESDLDDWWRRFQGWRRKEVVLSLSTTTASIPVGVNTAPLAQIIRNRRN